MKNNGVVCRNYSYMYAERIVHLSKWQRARHAAAAAAAVAAADEAGPSVRSLQSHDSIWLFLAADNNRALARQNNGMPLAALLSSPQFAFRATFLNHFAFPSFPLSRAGSIPKM